MDESLYCCALQASCGELPIDTEAS